MFLDITHIITALAFGTAGCMGTEDETFDEQPYALNGESAYSSSTERIDPAAQELNTEIVSMDLVGRTRLFTEGAAPDMVPGQGPEIRDAGVEYYEVEGDTCEEAKEDMESKGYTIDGEWRAGKAETSIAFACGYTPAPGAREDRKYCCSASITDLATECKATVYLPEWGGSDPCWGRFIEALAAHEQGHVDICQDYARRLNDAISGLTSTMCSAESMAKACDDALADLEQKADSAFNSVSQQHEDAQDAYDAGNDHGKGQGAVLDCNCK